MFAIFFKSWFFLSSEPDRTLAFKEDETKEFDYGDTDIDIILSLQEEDELMHDFGEWLMSRYGKCKNKRSANKDCN